MRVGKLGEIAFAKFLSDHGKALLGTEDMFTVWSDTHTVDEMDFQTTDGKTIDVKTASRDFHKNILVPYDQYKRQPKVFLKSTVRPCPSVILPSSSTWSKTFSTSVCAFSTSSSRITQ